MMINIIVYSFFCFLVNVLKYYVTSVEDNFMSIIFCFVTEIFSSSLYLILKIYTVFISLNVIMRIDLC